MNHRSASPFAPFGPPRLHQDPDVLQVPTTEHSVLFHPTLVDLLLPVVIRRFALLDIAVVGSSTCLLCQQFFFVSVLARKPLQPLRGVRVAWGPASVTTDGVLIIDGEARAQISSPSSSWGLETSNRSVAGQPFLCAPWSAQHPQYLALLESYLIAMRGISRLQTPSSLKVLRTLSTSLPLS